jgi:hypothetical protein
LHGDLELLFVLVGENACFPVANYLNWFIFLSITKIVLEKLNIILKMKNGNLMRQDYV